MTSHRSSRPGLLAAIVASLACTIASSGCSVLPVAKPAPAPSFFTLEADQESAIGSGSPFVAETESAIAIAIALPRARGGHEGTGMAYVTRPYEIRYFARHRWIEPPARLLEPLLWRAFERTGRWRPTPVGRVNDSSLRLETEIVALQQEFTVRPSRVRFRLRAELFDAESGHPIATTEIESVEAPTEDDPYAGVVAANRAVARVLDELIGWVEGARVGRDRRTD